MKKACFIDRDGVLIREKNYLSNPADIEFESGTFEALRLLKQNEYQSLVVSNQSGVARGYFSCADVDAVNNKINDLLQIRNLYIDAFYYCPHYCRGRNSAYVGACSCRKPEPGMILKAASDFKIDLSKSFIVGDKFTDVQAGINAGCAKQYLVKTGQGENEIKKGLKSASFNAAENLYDAVKSFLKSN